VNERFKDRRARLAQLEQELAQLKKQRKVLEREFRREDPEDRMDARRAPPKAAGPQPAREEERAPEPGSSGVPGGAPPKEDEDRERFAHYFMTGSLGSHTPQLRHERRAMRNKAIVMAILAFVFLFALVRFLVK
jgi:hypothetical protein